MRPPTTKITDLAALAALALTAVALAPVGALAQSAGGPTATVAQQWSSRIVSSDELAPPSSVSTTTTTLRKVSRKVRKALVTSTTLASGVVAPALPRATASADQSADQGFAPEVWLALRKCESNDRYDLNTGNGYYGAYQFKLGTWQKLGFPGYPHDAPPAVQDDAARVLQSKLGWGQWGACSRRLGLR